MDRARAPEHSRGMNEHTTTGGIMVRLLEKKRSALLALGLTLGAVAIVAGYSAKAGSGSASDRPATKAMQWRLIADAPEPIAAERTTVWTGTEMIVTGVNPGPD